MSDSAEEEHGTVRFRRGAYGFQGKGAKSVMTAVDFYGDVVVDEYRGSFRFFYRSRGGGPFQEEEFDLRPELPNETIKKSAENAILSRIPEPKECPQAGFLERIFNRIESGEAPFIEVEFPEDVEINELKSMIKIDGTYLAQGSKNSFLAYFEKPGTSPCRLQSIDVQVDAFLEEDAHYALKVALAVLEGIYRKLPPVML